MPCIPQLCGSPSYNVLNNFCRWDRFLTNAETLTCEILDNEASMNSLLSAVGFYFWGGVILHLLLWWFNLNIESKSTNDSFWTLEQMLQIFLSFPSSSVGGCRTYDFDVALASIIPTYLHRVPYLPAVWSKHWLFNMLKQRRKYLIQWSYNYVFMFWGI